MTEPLRHYWRAMGRGAPCMACGGAPAAPQHKPLRDSAYAIGSKREGSDD